MEPVNLLSFRDLTSQAVKTRGTNQMPRRSAQCGERFEIADGGRELTRQSILRENSENKMNDIISRKRRPSQGGKEDKVVTPAMLPISVGRVESI